MAEHASTIKGLYEYNRLKYIEPNDFASYFNQKNDNIKTTEFSWNPEDLAMSVDLQVIIPRRSDKGQISYLKHIQNVNIQNHNISSIGRFISYMGGVPLDERDKSESYLTDNYTNISFQEIKDGVASDTESLGIDSIDINFDAHFFPIVTMNFTDVRGSSLFMPSEYEFDESLKKDGASKCAGSFFKALFHFPYPRFLLSVKGFYGDKVTFQLAVSDFRSDFQSDTGNYSVTVQFIGYVYGLYTDLPLNLIMASPYYNAEYWNDRIESGVFKYVSEGGNPGGDILKYVDFLTRVEGKQIAKDALQNAPITREFHANKEKIKILEKIVELHKKITTEPVVDKTLTGKVYHKKQAFMWGRYYKEGDTEYKGFRLNEEIAKQYYAEIQKYLETFDDDISDGNVYIQALLKKNRDDGTRITRDMIKSDKTNDLCKYFQCLEGNQISDFFTFQARVEGESDEAYESHKYIITNNDGFKTASGDDTEFVNDDRFLVGKNLRYASGNYNGDITNGIFIEYEGYCEKLTKRINNLTEENKKSEEDVLSELSTVFEGIIGFAPTVENFYRMLFAHIDCFMEFFNHKVLGAITDQSNGKSEKRRNFGWFNNGGGDKIDISQLDIPKTMAGGSTETENTLNVFPFPGYYTTENSKLLAEYPGESQNERFKEIEEVDAVEKILRGIQLLADDFKNYLKEEGGNPFGSALVSKLSLLYNGSNPWETLKIDKLNDDDDIFHILYYYCCLLAGEKAVSGNQEIVGGKVKDEYIQRQVDALFSTNLNYSNTFLQALEEVRNTINNDRDMRSGYIHDKFLDHHKNGKYKLLYFAPKQEVGSQTMIVRNTEVDPDGKNKINVKIPLVIDDDILTKPACTFDDNEKIKYKVVNANPKYNEKYGRLMYFSKNGLMEIPKSSDENFGISSDVLKDCNQKLVEYQDANTFLDGKDSIPFGYYNVSLLDKNTYGKNNTWVYCSWTETEYQRPGGPNSVPVAVPVRKTGWKEAGSPDIIKGSIKKTQLCINRVVSYNCNNSTFKQRNHYEYPGTEYTTLDCQLPDIKIETSVDKEVVESLKNYYETDGKDRHINFVGRKGVGETTVDPTLSSAYKIDLYTASNLFSGVKKMILNNKKILCGYADHGFFRPNNKVFRLKFSPGGNAGEVENTLMTDKVTKNGLIFYPEVDRLLPLIQSRRCREENDGFYITDKGNGNISGVTWNFFDVVVQEPTANEKYAFAAYFLATLCGENGLGNILNKLSNASMFCPVRRVELLYLGASLYFKTLDCCQWKDKGSDIYELLYKTGSGGSGALGGGLLNSYMWDENKQNKHSISVIPENVRTELINYFTDWCDNVLFGEGGYNDLAKVIPAEDESNEDYVTLSGWVGRSQGPTYSEVQGYVNGGKCETWLTSLAYSYEFVLVLVQSLPGGDRNEICIYKDELFNFLDKLYAKLTGKENEAKNDEEREKQHKDSVDKRRGVYYLLKNLYDKWLCTYSAKDFELHTPVEDLELRRNRFCNSENSDKTSEYNNFVYVDQYFGDISNTYMMDVDTIATMIKSVYTGNKNMDVYAFMAFMAEKNQLMLMALPVYNNMYNAKAIASVFSPNILYTDHNYDNANGIGTTYVLMYASDVSHQPSIYEGYEYNKDYIDIANITENQGSVDLNYFNNYTSETNSELDRLDYDVAAFAVSYGKQNQMYFKKVNVNMDNPKVTDESIRNTLALSEGGNQTGTNESISIGQNIYSIYSNRSYTCTVEMMGCANITPLMYFQLNNIPMFRGLYMIINVKHTIKAGDMTTVFTGVRVSKYSLPVARDVLLNSALLQTVEKKELWKEGTPVNPGNCSHCSKVDITKYLTADGKLKDEYIQSLKVSSKYRGKLRKSDGSVWVGSDTIKPENYSKNGKVANGKTCVRTNSPINLTDKYYPFCIIGAGKSPNKYPGKAIAPRTIVETIKYMIDTIFKKNIGGQGAKTISDYILGWHMGPAYGTLENFIKTMVALGCKKDHGSGKMICAQEWIDRQLKYQQNAADFMHIDIDQNLQYNYDMLYRLISYILIKEQSTNITPVLDSILRQLGYNP